MVHLASSHEHMTTEIYFGVRKTEKFYLDTAKTQWVEFVKMNEGDRAEYQDSVAGAVEMDQETKKVKIENNIGADRASLCKTAVCGYSIKISEEETLTEFDKTKWSDLYDTMDGDKAQELFESIAEFNGFTDKKK
jgi:hypothetical protein